MTEYTIAAIPTVYRGVQYRSRLEARWAAFFDRLGWAHGYEPFDLGVWSPDFLLTDLDVLVEVKPLTQWDQETANRMYKGAGKPSWLLLTRVAPEVAAGAVNCGWICDPTGQFHHAMIGWIADEQRPVLRATFPVPPPKDIPEELAELRDLGCWAPPDVYLRKGTFAWRFYTEYVMKLWADACNAVQWEPGS